MAHAWEFGWIIRYEDGYTPVTGYSPEPWHLRYIGPELAAAYHDGGWHTLEEFFGLAAAPGYLGSSDRGDAGLRHPTTRGTQYRRIRGMRCHSVERHRRRLVP